MNTRTDEHRPSTIQPENYDFVAFEYLRVDGLGEAQFLISERARIRAHMDRTGGTYSGHQHGGNCHICGSVNAIYTALFYHHPSNAYVRTGLDCAEKLDCQEVGRFRRNVASALEARAGKGKAQALLVAVGIAKAWEVYAATERDGFKYEEMTITDIVGKLVKYGSLSDPQISFLRKLCDRIANRAAIEAQRAAEREAAKPVPVTSERMTVRGRVLSIKVPDYDRGDCGPVRMLVQHADGWKVWGSVPKAIETVARDSVVEFDAAINPSDRDPKFGFFRRPTKAQIIEGAA